MEVSKEVQEKILNYVTGLEEAVKKGADFASEQAPMVAQEIIWFARAESSLYVLFSLIVVCAAFYVLSYIKQIQSWSDWSEDSKNGASVGALCISVVAGCVGLGIFCYNIMPCVKTWIAPRLILIEKLMELAN